VTGFGWFADNLWPVVTGLILPPVLTEFHGSGMFRLHLQTIFLIRPLSWTIYQTVTEPWIAYRCILLGIGFRRLGKTTKLQHHTLDRGRVCYSSWRVSELYSAFCYGRVSVVRQITLLLLKTFQSMVHWCWGESPCGFCNLS